MTNILAINPGHNASAALVVDGELVFYAEEERYSRMKRDGNPFRAMLHVLHNWRVDEFVIGGTIMEHPRMQWTNEDPYSALVRKFNPQVKITDLSNQHHLSHAAAAFYASGFDTALAVVVDGTGNLLSSVYDQERNLVIQGYETESIFLCSYPSQFELVYKRLCSSAPNNTNLRTYTDGTVFYDDSVTITKAYEAVSEYLGFGFIEAGKTMGLAPYGERDDNIPPLFVDRWGNKNLLIPMYPAGALLDEARYPHLHRLQPSSAWHHDEYALPDVAKNLAWHVQQETQQQVANLIQQAIEKTGEKNVILSGGYALNCVANYHFLEIFPDVNFYIDPIAHDGGSAIGLAKLAHHATTGDDVIRPLKSVYLGAPVLPQQYDAVLQGFAQPVQDDQMTITKVTVQDVANRIVAGKIVAVFQGQAEGGPRALGNRSLTFDPRNPNGKNIVNLVKGREWFRPFAGSVLAEHADDWFDLRGLPDSAFMMYAVNVREHKVNDIPSITHVDGTCRVQTVTRDQNAKYYDLISEFHKQTGCPILFNTSFNLAGEPLVETPHDAALTFANSQIDCLWFADIDTLIEKK